VDSLLYWSYYFFSRNRNLEWK